MALEVDHNAVDPKSKKDKFKRKLHKQRKKVMRWSDDFSMAVYLEHDEDTHHMRQRYTKSFLTNFSEAYSEYEAGDWEAAANSFEAVKFGFSSEVEDGPSAALLRFLKKYDYQAPKDWPGFRFVC
jgi:hypothetical protein